MVAGKNSRIALFVYPVFSVAKNPSQKSLAKCLLTG
jgi:hypothetical protein